MKTELSGRVEKSKVIWDLPGFVKNAFAQFEGKKILVTVEVFKRKRSCLQNAYWWGVVIEIVYATFRGFGERVSRMDCHEMLKNRFLQQELVDPKTGELIGTYTRSTTEISTVEFMELIAEVQQYMAEQFSVVIPDPIKKLIELDEQVESKPTHKTTSK